MRRTDAPALVLTLAFALAVAVRGIAAAPAAALAHTPGGVRAPSAPPVGGSEYGVIAAAPTVPRPAVTRLSVPASVASGHLPQVSLRIDEPGVASVLARVAINTVATGRLVVLVHLGWIPTGRTVTVH